MERHIRPFLLATLVLLVSASAFAQTGQFAGQVTDPQGAVVPGAVVRIVSLATNVERNTKTNETGNFAAPFLGPGRYKIHVKAPGFETATSEDLTLTVGQTQVFNVQLKVGEASQELVVTAQAAQVNTTSTAPQPLRRSLDT